MTSETYPAEGTSARPAAARAPVREGDVLDGKFEIGATLGVGGMGIVVLARHREIGKLVALKFLLREGDGLVARFLREARAAAQLTSEHTTRVLDIGRLASGTPYLVMEYLRGESLAAWVERHARADTEDAVDWILQACEGLAEAHGRGIVHRDLKPANLFLAERADATTRLKILDFGISKLAVEAEEDPGLTTTGSVLGSPSYASPEQLTQPRSVDARADIWALGVTLYQLVAGARPFEGETLPTLYMRILAEVPLRPDERAPGVPRALADVVMRCLEKERSGRFADVVALAAALEPFAPPRARGATERVRAALLAATRARGEAKGALVSPRGSPRARAAEEVTLDAPYVAHVGSHAHDANPAPVAHEAASGAPRRRRIIVATAIGAASVVAIVSVVVVRTSSHASAPLVSRSPVETASEAPLAPSAAPERDASGSLPDAAQSGSSAVPSSVGRTPTAPPRPSPAPKRDPRSYR